MAKLHWDPCHIYILFFFLYSYKRRRHMISFFSEQTDWQIDIAVYREVTLTNYKLIFRKRFFFPIQNETCMFFADILVQREFLKTRFSRCMLYMHNAAIGIDWNLFFGIIHCRWMSPSPHGRTNVFFACSLICLEGFDFLLFSS